MFETILLAGITMADVWWTLYVVRGGLAIEANPLMAWALAQGTPIFVLLKLAYLVPALIVFEWVRGMNASFARLAATVSVWGYVAFYALASIRIHGLF